MNTIKTNDDNTLGYIITDFELSEKDYGIFDKTIRDNASKDFSTYTSHAFVSFRNAITYIFNISKESVDDVFKNDKILYTKLFEVFKREFHFTSDNSCSVEFYGWKDDVTQKDAEAYLVQLTSYIDVITNSSSELFAVESDKSVKELENLLKSLKLKEADFYSGDGGDIEVNELSVLPYLKMYIYNNFEDDDYNEIAIKLVKKDFTKDEITRMNQILKESYGYDKNSKLFILHIDNGFKSIQEFVKKELKGKYLGDC